MRQTDGRVVDIPSDSGAVSSLLSAIIVFIADSESEDYNTV